VRFLRLAIAAAGGLILAQSLQGCGAQPQGGPSHAPAVVGVITIEPQAVALQTQLAGRTSPFEISDVRPQVGGIIKARLFKEGALVRAGQVLYLIEPAPFQAAYEQAMAQLANAQANLVTTQLKAQRYGDLVKINAVSRQDYDDAQAAYGQARANVQQQRAAAQAARINLAFTRVTAPIAGRIGLSSVTPGALVTASQTTALTTIQRLDPIYVDVTQSSGDLLALRRDMSLGQLGAARPAGTSVRLSLEDGSDYPLEGRLQFTDITVDPTTGGVTLRAVFPNPSGLLLPGMYVRANVTEGVDPAGLLVPQQGVSRDAKGNPTVLIVDRRGRVELRQIATTRTVGPKWLVTSGLAAGDRVIVEGLQSAQPGAAVRAVPASAGR
jgi:membrane fusion protein (multidrug efflux system)